MAPNCRLLVGPALSLSVIFCCVGQALAAEPTGGKGAAAPTKQPGGDAKALVSDPFAAVNEQKASAPPSVPFEDLLKQAVPVSDLATLIEPLYARCEDKDDLPRRQCDS